MYGELNEILELCNRYEKIARVVCWRQFNGETHNFLVIYFVNAFNNKIGLETY